MMLYEDDQIWTLKRICRALGMLEGMLDAGDAPAPVMKAATLLMEVVNGRDQSEVQSMTRVY